MGLYQMKGKTLSSAFYRIGFSLNFQDVGGKFIHLTEILGDFLEPDFMNKSPGSQSKILQSVPRVSSDI